MARCGFCDRAFKSKQSVRAHLKACPEKSALGKPAGKAALGKSAYKANSSSGISESVSALAARDMKDRLEAEKHRLELRRIKSEHSSFDAAEREAKLQIEERRLAEAGARRQRAAELLAVQANREELARRERIAAELAAKRRSIIQRLKSRVMRDCPYGLPNEYRAAAFDEIERNLDERPVDELPEDELVLIAEAARDAAVRPWLQQEKDRDRAAMERLQQSLDSDAKRRELLNYAESYFEREKNLQDSSQQWEWFGAKHRIMSQAGAEIRGDESKAEVRRLVNQAIDEFVFNNS